jgi:predicted RNA-binding Zn-ribbon protein involved in translation (DUF1610 family)
VTRRSMASAHITTADTRTDAPRASKVPLARNGSTYARQCFSSVCHGNWFLAHTYAQLSCPYCGKMSRVQSRRSSKRWAVAYRQLLDAAAVKRG